MCVADRSHKKSRNRSINNYKYIHKKYSDKKLIPYVNKSTCVSARDFGIIIGISPFQNQLNLLFEKCGFREDSKFTQAMQRGVDNEKTAISMFADICNIDKDKLEFPGFTRHSKYDFIGGVPDAVFKNEKGENVIIEAKCPEKFTSGPPSQYYNTQIQVYMNIFNAKKGYLVEYVENKGIKFVEITRNNKWFQDIIPIVDSFWKDVCYWRENDITRHRLFPGCVEKERV